MIRHGARIIKSPPRWERLSSMGHYGLCLWSAAKFQRQRKPADKSIRPAQAVSILKPLRGTDPEMYESFRTHCLQDYPEYEIIFGVAEANDPAIPLVEQLKAEFPQREIRLTICRKNLGANTKVSNLAQMVCKARYEYLIVNDSDIRVAARLPAPASLLHLADPGSA